jgi:cellulose synthase/poly-beta-1,6-N-acetylglucosamine synthase-like glycosyltransferase
MAVAAVCVYVDSASEDNSVAIAESRGAVVLCLPDDGRLSPARARNEGLLLLERHYPKCTYVFFLDGDCVVSPSWLSDACLMLDRQPGVGVLCGHLKESAPDDSVYNRLFTLAWQELPDGVVLSCGGIFLARAKAMSDCGAFQPDLRSGEELHMCWRMARRGWQVLRVPGVMATHDADMHSLRQWLARSRRDGYGAMQVLTAEPSGVGRYQVRPAASAWLWTVGWAVSMTIGFATALSRRRIHPVVSVALPVIGVLPVAKGTQIAYRDGRRGNLSTREAAVYGALMMVSKWSYVHGQVLSLLHHARRAEVLRSRSHHRS